MEFELSGEFVELNQLLKLVGLCDSGGAGKVIVASGDVMVDGLQELRKTAKIRAGQVVRLGDVEVTVVAGEISSLPPEKKPPASKPIAKPNAKPIAKAKINPYQPGEHARKTKTKKKV